jgi:hypothetical protein
MRVLISALMLVGALATYADASILADTVLRAGSGGIAIVNTLEDNDREVITKVGADPTRFEEGDIVTFYLEVETISSSDGFYDGDDIEDAAGIATYELLGKGVFTISDIIDNGDGTGDFSFVGTIEFRESTTADFDFGAGVAAAEAEFASAGAAVFMLGLDGIDDFIHADDAPIEFADIPLAGDPVTALFGLSFIGVTDISFVPDFFTGAFGGLHDVIGRTDAIADPALVGGDGPGGDVFDLRTNTDFSIAVLGVIPEPMSLLVWGGLAMCGCIASSRRHRA